jgi:hypothetical protein
MLACCCESCGTATLLDVHCCGRCAAEWQTPDGKRRIATRRAANGLPTLQSASSSAC